MARKREDPAPTEKEIQELLKRVPPHFQEAEMALLGSMILAGARDVHIIGEVMDIMRGPGDFFWPKHQALYQALIELYNERASIDTVQLTKLLRAKDVYNEVGGIEYLVELAECVPTAVNAPHYAKDTLEFAKLRDLVDESARTLRTCYDRVAEGADNLIEDAEQRIFAITDRGKEATSSQPLSISIKATFEELQERQGGPAEITGLRTGFAPLDEMTTGLHAGEMIILAARPSMGKTSLALNIADNVAVTQNLPVGIFSLEMSRKELGIRMLSSRASVDSQRMKRNQVTKNELNLLEEASKPLATAPIYVDDGAGLSIHQVRGKARRMRARDGIELLIIDYLQLMSGTGRRQERVTEVGEISRGVKAIAKELEIPVICLSQLNRKSTERASLKPKVEDLRESGAIEQDADIIALLHREEQHHADDYKKWAEDNPDKIGLAELIIGKQRNGPIGTINLHYSGQTTTFSLAASKHIRQSEIPTEHLYTGGD